MSDKSWCDHCGDYAKEISLIYVENMPIWACNECLDKHYPLV